uniref:Uncharacterized protein n=2 Tax=Anguilla anguilla TaxID=7936 RepID=A0A0E9P7H7_ANGAN
MEPGECPLISEMRHRDQR